MRDRNQRITAPRPGEAHREDEIVCTSPFFRTLLVRELDAQSKVGGDTDPAGVLWLCVTAYEMASAAAQPLDKFMKAFPALDLLASRHHKDHFE
jgi:hypothetical protein